MKILNEQSIKILGFGMDNTKTIFNLHKLILPENPTNEEIKEYKRKEIDNQLTMSSNYKSIKKLSGGFFNIYFEYDDNLEKKTDKILLNFIVSQDEESIKNNVIDQINLYLQSV